ncbi:MAG: HPr family phosphocarrier protein [Oscillospiraceae bacterium]|nr:HPr family phosphocarrier protein [Oscillospiraceae bacterium]
MTFDIKIRNSADAQELNRIANQYPFDIWVHGVSGQADAKSILGLILFTLESDVKLVVPDGVDTKQFEQDMKEYIAR